MMKLRKEARAEAAEMVKFVVGELESKPKVIDRGDLWPAIFGVAITVAGSAVGGTASTSAKAGRRRLRRGSVKTLRRDHLWR